MQRRYSGPAGAFVLAGDIAVGTIQEGYATLCDLATGVNNNDPNAFGRGLSRIAMALGTAVATRAGAAAIAKARTSGGAPRVGITLFKTESEYAAVAGDFYAKGILNPEGVLTLNFRTKIINAAGQELRHPNIRGAEQFAAIINHFGKGRIKKILAIWSDGDNLDAFNALTAQGVSNADAALGTWTGGQAKAAGYGNVTGVDAYPPGRPGHYRAVTVYFEP